MSSSLGDKLTLSPTPTTNQKWWEASLEDCFWNSDKLFKDLSKEVKRQHIESDQLPPALLKNSPSEADLNEAIEEVLKSGRYELPRTQFLESLHKKALFVMRKVVAAAGVKDKVQSRKPLAKKKGETAVQPLLTMGVKAGLVILFSTIRSACRGSSSAEDCKDLLTDLLEMMRSFEPLAIYNYAAASVVGLDALKQMSTFLLSNVVKLSAFDGGVSIALLLELVLQEASIDGVLRVASCLIESETELDLAPDIYGRVVGVFEAEYSKRASSFLNASGNKDGEEEGDDENRVPLTLREIHPSMNRILAKTDSAEPLSPSELGLLIIGSAKALSFFNVQTQGEDEGPDGDNEIFVSGESGFSPTTTNPCPASIFDGYSIKTAAAGSNCSFFLTTDGELYSFGKGDYGRLGLGHTNTTSSPARLEFPQPVERFAVSQGGYGHGFAVLADDSLWVWGDSDYGKLGTGEARHLTSPERLNFFDNKNLTDISCGWQHSAAACDGHVYTWGLADDDRLGDRPSNTTAPTKVELPDGCPAVTKVVCGQNFTAAVTQDGMLLVVGATSLSARFAFVELDGEKVVQMAAGADFGVFLTDCGNVWSFGPAANSGTGGMIVLAQPVQLLDITSIKFVACSGKDSFAITSTNEVFAWGQSYRMTPQIIEAASAMGIGQISGGSDHTLWSTAPAPSLVTCATIVPVKRSPFTITLTPGAFSELLKALNRFSDPSAGDQQDSDRLFLAQSLLHLVRANVLHFVGNRMSESEIDSSSVGILRKLREILVNCLSSASPPSIQQLAQTIFAESWAALLPREAPQRKALITSLLVSAQDELTSDKPLSPSILFLTNVLVDAIEVDSQFAKSFGLSPTTGLVEPVDEDFFVLADNLLRTCTGVVIRNTELRMNDQPLITKNPFLSLIGYLQQFVFTQRLGDLSQSKESTSEWTDALTSRWCTMLTTAAEAVLMHISVQESLDRSSVAEILKHSVLRNLLQYMVMLQSPSDNVDPAICQILHSLDELNRSFEGSEEASRLSLTTTEQTDRSWLLVLEEVLAYNVGANTLQRLRGSDLTETEEAHLQLLGKQLFSGGLKDAIEPSGRHASLLKDLVSESPCLETTTNLLKKVFKYGKSQWLLNPVVDKEHSCIDSLMRRALACQLQHHGLVASAVLYADDAVSDGPPPSLIHVISTTFEMRNRLYSQLYSEYPHLTKHHEDEEALFKEEDDLAKALAEPVIEKLEFLMKRVRAAIAMEESIAPQRSTVGETGGGYFDLRASAPAYPNVLFDREASLRSAITRDDSAVKQKRLLLREDMNESLWKPMSVVVGTLRRYQLANKGEVEATRKDLSRQIEDFVFNMELKLEDMEESFKKQQQRAESRLAGVTQSIDLVRKSASWLPSARTYLLHALVRDSEMQSSFRDIAKDIRACSRDTRNLLEEQHHDLLRALLEVTDELGSTVADIVSLTAEVTGKQRDLITLLHGLTCRFSASDVDVLVQGGVLQRVLSPVLRISLDDKTKFRTSIFSAGVRAYHSLLGAASIHAEHLDLSTVDEIQSFVRDLLALFLENRNPDASVFLDFLYQCMASEHFCSYFSSGDWIEFFLEIASSSSLARDRILALRTLSILMRSLSADTSDSIQMSNWTSRLASLYKSCLAVGEDSNASQLDPRRSNEIGFSTEPESTLKCKVLPSQDTIAQTAKAKLKDNGFAYGNVCFTSGKHSFKYKILVDRENDESFAVGIAQERPEPLSRFVFARSAFTWLLRTYKGSLYHNGEIEGSELGKCSKGDVLTMELDLTDPENGSLAIYKNGVQLGDGPLFSGIIGPVYPFVAFYNGYEECFVSIRIYDHIVLEDGDFKKQGHEPEELNIMFPSTRTTLLQEIIELFRQLTLSNCWSDHITDILLNGFKRLPQSLALLSQSNDGRKILQSSDAAAAHLSLQYLADAYGGARLGGTVDSPAHGFGSVLSFLPSGNTASVYFSDSKSAVTMAISPLSPVSNHECPTDKLRLHQAAVSTICGELAELLDAEEIEVQFLKVLITKAVTNLAWSSDTVGSLLYGRQSLLVTLLDLAAKPLPVKNLLSVCDLERAIYFIRELLYQSCQSDTDKPSSSTSSSKTQVEGNEGNQKEQESGSCKAAETKNEIAEEEDVTCEEASIGEEDIPEEINQTIAPTPNDEPRVKRKGILSRVFTLFRGEDSKPKPEPVPSPTSKYPKSSTKRKKLALSVVTANTVPDQELLESFFDFDTRLGSIGLSEKGAARTKSLKKIKFKPVKLSSDSDHLSTRDPLVPPPKLNSEELNTLISYVHTQIESRNYSQVERVLHLLLAGLQIQLAREAIVGVLGATLEKDGKPLVDTSQLDVTKLIQVVRLVVCGRTTSRSQEGINHMTNYLMQYCKPFSDKMLQYCIRVLFSMADDEKGDDKYISDHDALSSAKFAIARDLLSQLDESHPCYHNDLLDGLCVAALSTGAEPKQRSWCASRIASIVHTTVTGNVMSVAGLKNSSVLFSQFCELLPSVISGQVKLEKRNRCAGLTRSVFLQSLLAIAHITKLKVLKKFPTYSLVVDCSEALHTRSGRMPQHLFELMKLPVDIPKSDIETALDNSKWTLGMDMDLLNWKQTIPEDWANPTDVYCCGDASVGALGTIDFNPPTPLLSSQFSSLSPVKVVGGETCTFLLDAEGFVFAVGKGDYGRLGIGSSTNTVTPQQLNFGDVRVRDMHASHGGYGSGFAVDTEGQLWAWGDKDFGKLGIPESFQNERPNKVSHMNDVKHVFAANRHTVCVNGEELFVWGQAHYSNLGDITSPKLVHEIDNPMSAAGGEAHTIVLSDGGNKVWAFGDNSEGELGLDCGDIQTPEVTAADIDDLPFIKVEAGANFSLLLSQSGRVYYTGSIGGTVCRGFTCVEELANEKIIDIAAGRTHMLALTEDGAVYAWGSNSNGQCGTGGGDLITTPHKMELPRHIRHITCGASHSVVWSSENSLENLLPQCIPTQYESLNDYYGAALLVRLRILQKFSDLMFKNLSIFLHAGRQWFHFDSVKPLLTLRSKVLLLDNYLHGSMNPADHGPSVTVNRFIARTPQRSVFCQVARGIDCDSPGSVMCHSRAFRVELTGEGSYDAGGPYNDIISHIAEELMDCRTPVTELTENGLRKEGNFQDCVVPAPMRGKNMEKLFEFLGVYLGIAIRTHSPVDLTFPPIFWKLLLEESVGLADLEEIDRTFVQSHQLLIDIEKNGITEDAFECLPLEMFPPLRLDGGGHLALSFHTRKRYVQHAIRQRITRWDRQITCIRNGIDKIVLIRALDLFTSEEVAELVCGSPQMDWTRLRNATSYTSGLTSSSEVIVWLWEVLATFSNKDASRFLRFVWGKSRLPRRLTSNLTIEGMGTNDNALPKSATCFFKLSLPQYSSKEILEKRLRTAILYCTAIDTDNDTGMQGFAEEQGFDHELDL